MATYEVRDGELPNGAELIPLTSHPDERGTFTEIWREEWSVGIDPPQWNVVSSQAGVLRGVHLHFRHVDYLFLAAGRVSIGLYDLREDQGTSGMAAMIDMEPGGAALRIPTGVAHGFCYPEPSVHVYAVSCYFDPTDELGCRYDDPELGLDWPVDSPLISERDGNLSSLAELRDQYTRGAEVIELRPSSATERSVSR